MYTKKMPEREREFNEQTDDCFWRVTKITLSKHTYTFEMNEKSEKQRMLFLISSKKKRKSLFVQTSKMSKRKRKRNKVEKTKMANKLKS